MYLVCRPHSHRQRESRHPAWKAAGSRAGHRHFARQDFDASTIASPVKGSPQPGPLSCVHLEPARDVGSTPRRLKNTGYGFGRRRFDELSNVLRVLQFDDPAESVNQDRVTVIRFEVDDQTAEDLAIGLDRIRDVEGVIDVVQMSLTGKQGRLATGIQVLARPSLLTKLPTRAFSKRQPLV